MTWSSYLFSLTALQVFSKVNSTLGRRELRECIDAICQAFPDEDVFDPLIAFLTSSVEVSVVVYLVGLEIILSLLVTPSALLLFVVVVVVVIRRSFLKDSYFQNECSCLVSPFLFPLFFWPQIGKHCLPNVCRKK